MKDSFVFYKSFWEVFEMLEDPSEWRDLLRSVCNYSFDGIEPEFDSPALKIAFKHFQISIDGASARYEKAIEDGKKGGRPSKQDYIPPDVWIAAIEEHGSVPKAAKALGLAKKTLYNWVNASDDPRVQKCKNLSVSESVSVSDSVSESDKRKRFKNAPVTSATDPDGSPPCPSKKKAVDPFFEQMRKECGLTGKFEAGADEKDGDT